MAYKIGDELQIKAWIRRIAMIGFDISYNQSYGSLSCAMIDRLDGNVVKSEDCRYVDFCELFESFYNHANQIYKQRERERIIDEALAYNDIEV